MDNRLLQIADNEARVPRNSGHNRLMPHLADWAIRNGLDLANAYQVPRDLGANLVNMLMQAPGAIAGATQAHLTGEVPLVTGEPGRAFTDADAARGAKLAVDATGNAGLMGGLMAGRAAQAIGASTKPSAGITAYHGSPHDFDRFSMDRIGTGEGAQAYGHGLYFAESPDVARAYREQLSPKTIAEAQAQTLAEAHGRSWADMGGYERQQYVDEAIKLGYPPANKVGGRLYEVKINANRDDFLDFDKTIGEQPEHIRKILDPLGEQGDLPTASPLMFARHGNDGEVWAKRLKEAGIPGIKYLDQGSRGRGGKTYNYVVFDENLIEIANKMGVAVPVPNMQGAISVSEQDMARIQKAASEDSWDIY